MEYVVIDEYCCHVAVALFSELLVLTVKRTVKLIGSGRTSIKVEGFDGLLVGRMFVMLSSFEFSPKDSTFENYHQNPKASCNLPIYSYAPLSTYTT